MIAFNLMALVYPVSGCIREFGRFGVVDVGMFFYNIIKAIKYDIILLVKICFLECPALTSKFIVLLVNSCPKINASIADMMIRRNVESYTIPLKISAREEAISSVDPMISVT